nr:substrate-binding domain-containing protein [Paludibacter sp.]
MRKHIKLIYLLTSVVILSFFSCVREKKDKYTDTLTEGVIQVAIDETFAPILEDEITVFESVTPKAGIVPIFTTEGNAIELLLKDSVRMAITTRPLSEKEIASLHARKFQPRLYRLASDAIALVVNNSNPDSLITVDQLRRILTGKITNWNQIFPNSKLGKIVTVFDNPNSSTVRYAIDSVCGGLPISTNLNAQTTNSEVLDYVARTPQALGLV